MHKVQKKPNQRIWYISEAKSITGQNVSLEDYDGKVLLIVNTASKCGLTPQYKAIRKALQDLQG